MTTITVCPTETRGTLKPLHGVNNGPLTYGSLVDVSPDYRDLAIPYVRLHDPNWPHPREVDIPQIFPNFDADPEDPASYAFARTDTYIQAILATGAQVIYRLGVSIEHTERKDYTAPPPDFDRWATICTRIIDHYNHGWAGGFHYAIPYWEIWNEPDIGDPMWAGTPEQYFDLYRTAATAIKAHAPEVKVGGYAAAWVENPFVERFLAMCEAHALPLDFFSWHTYTDRPEHLVANAQLVREKLDAHGYTAAESHLNEWNYMPMTWDVWGPGNAENRRRGFERQKNEEGAAFAAAALTLLQDAPVDVATYYDGQPSALFCGLFDYYGVPQKTYHAFRAFRQLLDYPDRVAVAVEADRGETDAGLRALAAADPATGGAACLISRFDGTAGEVAVRFEGAGAATGAEVCLIDRATDPVAVHSAAPDADHTVRLSLEPHAVALVTLT